MTRVERLGDHVDVVTGFPFKSHDYAESGIRLLRGDNIGQGRIRWSGAKYWPENRADESTRFLLSAGDVVLAMDRPWIEAGLKYAAVAESDLPCLLVQRVARLRAKKELTQPFLPYLVGSRPFVDYILGVQTGTGIPHISVGQIRDFRFPWVPISDQQAIAEVLGALDDKIALNERSRSTGLELASACYEAAERNGQPELIGDLATLFDGPHATPQKTSEGPWFLSISSLKGGYLDLAESAHLSEDDFPRWTRRVQPQAGDVLFSYETRLGDAALMPAGVRGSLGRRMAVLRSKSASLSGALLLHAYLAPAFQEEIKRRTIHGATVDRLPLKEMPGWRIQLPPTGDRERLSAKLDALHNSVMQTATENRTLADLRDTLLPQLITGKLRVKDAARIVEDEV
ncbi:restriction endonuclease subunit S [Streptomyces sp. BE230]|uniref:restriction endonuclease subunit S n=1 Tax=Streptomyces sp. BE230 TaxID=3002526 RepID=UPI002ED1DEED|nr:restriction endonuclease subunit S [Streptomyces sp. BE230]